MVPKVCRAIPAARANRVLLGLMEPMVFLGWREFQVRLYARWILNLVCGIVLHHLVACDYEATFRFNDKGSGYSPKYVPPHSHTTHTHSLIHTHTFIHTHMRAHTHSPTHTHTHTHTFIHTHTHTHSHTYPPLSVCLCVLFFITPPHLPSPTLVQVQKVTRECLV